MRIVAGKYGRRRLNGPSGGRFRPTSDRVREALFNVLGPLDESVSFADVFAGSGAVGIEAMSRGAGRVVWVEVSGSACWTIRKNLEQLPDRTSWVLEQKKAALFVETTKEQFDYVFADPPYHMSPVSILETLTARDLLKPGGLLILEHERQQPAPDVAGSLHRTDSRHYGGTSLSFYRPREETDDEKASHEADRDDR